ncbi:MAG: nucleoside triphosphate pyrophosphohydrolase [Gammaproteobacteria bacterium]|nr:MAG: nucleoside triphosphate pyrophosphohydrolase [Gammaproteobacteria bacterium]TLZ47736.1 MAG: nucleoside triphosphate pyrophosphohydrolase [Gammaproteobacteria bacterium]
MSEAERALGALLALMARLRDPQRGCPWDREQTFSSIAPYTIEEAYEVADAIERGEREALRDELGDLLFQVVFHARMAEERGWFDFAAVATTIHDKLVRRHPHVFAGASPTPQELVRAWEEQKAQERAASAGPEPAGEGTVLAGVPRALPALVRAAKLGHRAAGVGFDWPDAREVRAKVLEELHEMDGALAAGEAGEAGCDAGVVADELGDLLFSIVNWSRHLKLDAEAALRAANAKFERRFATMESLARARSLDLESLSAAEWDALWREAKLNGT